MPWVACTLARCVCHGLQAHWHDVYVMGCMHIGTMCMSWVASTLARCVCHGLHAHWHDVYAMGCMGHGLHGLHGCMHIGTMCMLWAACLLARLADLARTMYVCTYGQFCRETFKCTAAYAAIRHQQHTHTYAHINTHINTHLSLC